LLDSSLQYDLIVAAFYKLKIPTIFLDDPGGTVFFDPI